MTEYVFWFTIVCIIIFYFEYSEHIYWKQLGHIFHQLLHTKFSSEGDSIPSLTTTFLKVIRSSINSSLCSTVSYCISKQCGQPFTKWPVSLQW